MGDEIEAGRKLGTCSSTRVPESLRNRTITIAESDAFVMRRLRSRLTNAGFGRVCGASDLSQLANQEVLGRCDLLVLDLYLDSEAEKTLQFLERERARGFRGIAAVSAQKTTKEFFFRAAKSGANDFLIKGKQLDIAAESIRLLQNSSPAIQNGWRPERIAQVGFFRSLGLTKGETEILIEFARDFSRQQRLAQRIELSEPSIRKSFSRIYKKMSRAFEIENPAQLSHVLTICSLYA